MTTDSSTDGAATFSRMNFSGYVGHVAIFSWILTNVCCLVVRLEQGLGLDCLVSGWLEVMHTYMYYFALSLYRPLPSATPNKKTPQKTLQPDSH